MKKAKDTETKLISFSNIKSTMLEYLWYPYIPLGKITILQGDPGGGKSFLSILIASIISLGGKFPYSDEKVDVGNVILQNGEDGIDDTIKARLEKVNANCDKIFIIDESNILISFACMSKFEEACEEIKPKLIIIDPLQRYIGDLDMSSAIKVRRALTPVIKLAQKYKCAVLIISHMNKGDGKALYKTLGSIDIVGTARSVLTIGVNPSNEKERILSHTKSSCSEKGESIAFKITNNGIEWLGKRGHLTSDDIISLEIDKPRNDAYIFLKELLKDGGVDSNIVREEANKRGIAEPTLNRAKKDLKIKSVSTNGKQRNWEISKDE